MNYRPEMASFDTIAFIIAITVVALLILNAMGIDLLPKNEKTLLVCYGITLVAVGFAVGVMI